MAYGKVFATKNYITKTIDTGELTLDDWGICYLVDGEGSANDDLATITGGIEGQILIIKANGVTLTLKHGADNIVLTSGADVALTDGMQILLVLNDAGHWEDFLNVATPDLHKATHENNGSDEISLAGLSGEPADTVNKSLFDANTILAANSDNTPAAVTIAEQHIVGRLTGGNIGEVDIGTGDDDIIQVDDAGGLVDNEYPRATANGLESRSPAEVLTDLLSNTLAENDIIQLEELLSADGKYSGISCNGVYGATIAFGDLLYLNNDDGRWELADANQATTCSPQLGIALEAGNDEDTKRILLYGYIREDDWNWATIGAPLFVSTTDGDFTETAPAGSGYIIRIAGYVKTADCIFFNPGHDWLTRV